jgi:hypothetical protein
VVATVAACEKLAAGGEKKLVKVKWFNSSKEFGVITSDDGGDEESASNSDSDASKKKRPAAKPTARLPLAKKGKGVAPAAKEKADVKRSAQEVVELQAEMNDWKVIAADASEECSSLRVAFDNVVKELQAELAQ